MDEKAKPTEVMAPTGWDKLLSGGIKAGELFMMVAGNGVGKSKLMENQNGNI